jgi:predicted NAD/FAD-binding protein
MAVIGGGIGGVSTAYLCDDGWVIDLFEAEPRLGGNAATVLVDDVPVDLGAETFNPATHPLYWALLEEIGADRTVVTMPGTLSVFDAATRRPRFVSTRALRTPRHALGLLRFIRASRRFLAGDPSPDLTLAEWFELESFDRRFTHDVLLPWLASLTSSRVDTLETQSMLAFLTLFAPAFPSNLFSSPKTYASDIGLGGVVELLADRCRHLTVHTSAPVERVERVDGAWFVDTSDGRSGPYERVVVTAPPYAAREFLVGVPGEVLGILNAYEHYPARLIVHEDETLMPADERDWCMHNAAVSGDTCEATFWLGAYRRHPELGEPVRLFKSWATHRTPRAESIRAEHTFHHLLLTPAAVRAAEKLRSWQGRDGLHFAGHCTQVTDLQETALESAIAVAETLDADGPNLRSLRARVASRS